MPALLAALGGAFSWIVSALLSGLASNAVQKGIKFGVAVFMLPVLLGKIAEYLGGSNPFDVGRLFGTFLGGLPATIAYALDSHGVVAFLYVILTADLGVLAVTLYFRLFGATR